eukprot:2359393-Amphidinium_carterae.2
MTRQEATPSVPFTKCVSEGKVHLRLLEREPPKTEGKRKGLFAGSFVRQQARAGCSQAKGIKSLLARVSSFSYSVGLRSLGLRKQQQRANTVAPVVISSVLTGSNSYQTSKHPQTRKEPKRPPHKILVDLYSYLKI